MMKPFKAPDPVMGEMIHLWVKRVVDELERWTNEELTPMLVKLTGAKIR